jgi:hypothetical protein
MSIKTGTVTASVILRKLAAYPRQNGLAQALRELGKLERTLFTLDWLQDPELRRRSHVGLNKGEQQTRSIAQCSSIGSAKSATVRMRTNAIGLAALICWWPPSFYGTPCTCSEPSIICENQGIESGPNDLAHLSPLGWEHINLTGDYAWEAEESPNPDQFRPLRTRASELPMVA